jgi:D-alanyl-D-alanine carboxypeptidase/D-alanyl-D-alanine-endopeptidase (penicillin-binding protein 4)
MFKQSLPEAGTDGTLRRRMPELKGRVFAKTGSIGGVRALSGYGTTAEGRTVALSILCNDIKGDEDQYVKKIDEAVGVIVGGTEKVAEGERRRSPWAFVGK